jgi:putative membrane protein
MSKPEPYEKFDPDDLILRDWLALDRNKLANQRTFLAYVRTGLAFALLGVLMLKWFGHLYMQMTGWVSVGFGGLVAVLGLVHFSIERHRYKRLSSRKRE